VYIVTTDLVILAIHTLQVAVRKKNIADTKFAADNGLLASVYTDGCGLVSAIAAAIAPAAFEPVNPALPWA